MSKNKEKQQLHEPERIKIVIVSTQAGPDSAPVERRIDHAENEANARKQVAKDWPGQDILVERAVLVEQNPGRRAEK